MPAPEVIIPILEGTIGSVANGKESVALALKQCKEIMLMTVHKDQTDWQMYYVPDIDETAAAGPSVTAPETGGVMYALFVGQRSADASADLLSVCDDADGAIAAFAAGDTRVTDAPAFSTILPVAATDLTEEIHPFVFPEGISYATYMSFVADGLDGTNPDTDDIRAWVLCRTTAGVLA